MSHRELQDPTLRAMQLNHFRPITEAQTGRTLLDLLIFPFFPVFRVSLWPIFRNNYTKMYSSSVKNAERILFFIVGPAVFLILARCFIPFLGWRSSSSFPGRWLCCEEEFPGVKTALYAQTRKSHISSLPLFGRFFFLVNFRDSIRKINFNFFCYLSFTAYWRRDYLRMRLFYCSYRNACAEILHGSFCWLSFRPLFWLDTTQYRCNLKRYA